MNESIQILISNNKRKENKQRKTKIKKNITHSKRQINREPTKADYNIK